MAKKKELSIEEKLENALVPSWEQPYLVPKNWVWVRLGNLSTHMADGPFGSNLKREHYTSKKEVRIIQLSNIGEDGWRDENIKYTSFEHAKTISRSIVNAGEIVIAKMMPAGRAMLVPNCEKSYVLSSDAVKFVPNKKINSLYLVICINSTFFRNLVNENTQGITRARTSVGKLKEYPFPLPPIAEQERIVNRIESLFEKLDKAQELIENVLDSFDNRKSALLHQAFTGELTKKWREENGVSFESWEENKVDSVSTLITKGASPRWQGIEYTSDKSQTLFVTSENVREGYLDFIKEKYLDNKINEIQKRSVLKSGDVLLNIVGASIGRSAIFNLDVLANTNQAVAIIRVNTNVYNVFLSIYLNSPVAQDYYSYTKVDVARANISLGDIKNMPILLPSLPEQKEIVRILDSILEKEEEAKLQAQKSLEHIKQMKKAILARAFRGELGTNDENEENAIKLLKEVLGESN